MTLVWPRGYTRVTVGDLGLELMVSHISIQAQEFNYEQ